jgi:hypothetical protein
MKRIKPHGGKRKGAGRKQGSGKGRVAVSKSLSMTPEAWDKLDKKRGDLPRGKYVQSIL